MDTRVQEERLKDWYKAMKNWDKEEAALHKTAFETDEELKNKPEIHKLSRLLTARFHLMNQDLDLAASALAESVPEVDEDDRVTYFYHFFHGIYEYQRRNYTEAIDHYLKAEPIIKTKNNQEELAEFSYKLASAYHRTYHVVLSIEYAKQALRIFRTHSHYVRMAHCENLIALNYQEIKHYKETERHLRGAWLYAARIRDEEVKRMVLHNFGYFYSQQNDPKTALVYLMQAYELIGSDADLLKIQNLYLSAENYFKMDQKVKAASVLNEAHILARDFEHKGYVLRCDMLRAKYTEPSSFEKTYKTGIRYFHEKERWEIVNDASKELAAFYQKKSRYQEACFYYDLSITARDKIDQALSYYQ